TPTPEQIVQQAWELAQVSGTYNYRADMEQTTIPAPSLANAGRPLQTTQLLLEGSVNLSDETMAMTLWNDSSGDPNKGVAIRVEDGVTYGRLGQSEWQEIDNVADSFAPGGDPLGFLAGAANIQDAGTEVRHIGDLTLTLTRYTFDLDGNAFAAHMRQQMAEAMQKYGPLPQGMSLEMSAEYKNMSGQGELWLDEAGLPFLLTTDIQFPPQPNGDQVEATVSTSYSNFDQERIAQTAVSFLTDPAVWTSVHIPDPVLAAQNLTLLIGAGLLLGAMGFLVI
ncbi:MAG: hypothetical protein GY952_17515, partial [Rhodobacteraceae bacterium]|nr:hypothetical protein [Paracoccaceae bacterium]